MTETASAPTCQVAIVGAGPYGLAAAAHLRDRGLDVHVLGEPMSYWSEMPKGMLLRSPWHASRIADPRDELTLDLYEQTIGRSIERPIPLDDFVAYGRWFAEQVAPDMDHRRVATIDRAPGGFVVHLEDGDTFTAQRVVLATGLLGYDRRLESLAALPAGAVSHTSDLRDPADFAGRRVLVLGGGQSATESAALLQEAGADVEIVMRAERVNWLIRSGRLHRSRLRPMFYPDTDVGPPVLNQIVNRPRLFRSFPQPMQERMAYRSIRPAAAGWLRERLEPVTITCGRGLAGAEHDGEHLRVRLDDGSERVVDHLMQGTGFALDVRRHPLLAPSLAKQVRHHVGYPLLRHDYESSVQGLHFVGALSAISKGPVMRFVSGTWATGPALASGIVGARRRAGSRSKAGLAAGPVVADAGQPAS